jgi:hypothetical protein
MTQLSTLTYTAMFDFLVVETTRIWDQRSNTGMGKIPHELRNLRYALIF